MSKQDSLVEYWKQYRSVNDSPRHLLALFQGVVKMLIRRDYNVGPLAPLLNHDPTNNDHANAFAKYIAGNVTSGDRLTPVQRILLEDKRDSLRAMLSMVFPHNKDQNDHCLVFFADVTEGDHILVAETAMFSTLVQFTRAKVGILISNAPIQAISKFVEAETPGENFLQHFLDDELLYDPTECVYGSDTRILSGVETVSLLTENSLKLNQLAKIMTIDPVGKYLGIRPGQIAEHDRENILPESLIDREYFYRCGYNRVQERKSKK